VVREDPGRKGLLYAGTEFGLYVSFDDGRTWKRFQQGLAITPVTDLTVNGSDLVAATQGRSFWILDDVTPLRAWSDEVASAKAHLFAPRPTVRYPGGGAPSPTAGANPPGGVMIHYLLAEAPGDKNELKIEIQDARGTVLRSWSSLKEERTAPNPFARFLPPGSIPPRKLPAEAGLNRFTWDMRLADAEMVDDAVVWGTGTGPRVPPGSYRVTLSLGGQSQSQDITILKDPRAGASEADLQAQFELARSLWTDLSDTYGVIRRARDIRAQVNEMTRRLKESGLGEGLDALSKEVGDGTDAIERRLHQTKNQASQDALNFPPQLDNQIIALLEIVGGGEARPTDGAMERRRDLRAELDKARADLRSLESGALARFNERVRATGVPAVILPKE
jgi:hypothetical protein